jgi:hypothetical protein
MLRFFTKGPPVDALRSGFFLAVFGALSTGANVVYVQRALHSRADDPTGLAMAAAVLVMWVAVMALGCLVFRHGLRGATGKSVDASRAL